MKNNKLRLLKLFGLAVFTFCVLFASCEMFATPDIGDTPRDVSVSKMTVELERWEELALLHSAESHVTSREELQDMVSAVLSSETGSNRSSVRDVYSYSATIEDGFSSVTANRREAARKERSRIDFHVFYLEDGDEQGFAFTCSDDRIGNLLAWVPDGDFHDTENPFWQIFLSCIDNYIYETIDIYNSITDQDITDVRARTAAEGARFIGWNGYDFSAMPIVDQLLSTKWNQNFPSDPRDPHKLNPYNRIINTLAGNPQNLWPAGCVAVAMAQIVAYHEWPLRPPIEMLRPNTNAVVISNFKDPYVTNGDLYRSFSSISYNWDRIKYSYKTGTRKAEPNCNRARSLAKIII